MIDAQVAVNLIRGFGLLFFLLGLMCGMGIGVMKR